MSLRKLITGENLVVEFEPHADRSDGADLSRHVFRRFIFLAVILNIVVGSAVVIYDIILDLGRTQELLESGGDNTAGICRRMRASQTLLTDAEVVGRAAKVTRRPIALIDRATNAIAFSSSPRLPAAAKKVYEDEVPQRGIRVEIRDDLGGLSGGWLRTSFNKKYDLLVVVPRSIHQEGVLRYMTRGAAIIGLMVALSLVILVAAANSMVHRPLSRAVAQRTRALARDVIRRREAEEAAIDLHERAQETLAFRDNLLNSSDWVGIIATDLDGRIQIFNRAAEQILGYGETETVGAMTLRDLTRRTRMASLDTEAFEALTSSPGEQVWMDKSGAPRMLGINTSNILDASGETTGRLVVFIDMTERKRLERELKLNQMKLIQSAKMASLGEMATGVAHEINQPLNNIGLMTSRIGKRVGSTDPADEAFMREKLERIQGQVRRASRIIDQLRTFGHPGERKITDVRLKDTVKNVMELVGEQLRRKGVNMVARLPRHAPAVRVNRSHLEQVLVNLLINARDALGDVKAEGFEPRIDVEAATHIGPNGEGEVHLLVSDNGPGMTDDVVRRIFEPFFTTKEVGKGTGLGLAISYSLVQGFDGRLEVESRVGQGTTFTIAMKAGQDQEAAPV